MTSDLYFTEKSAVLAAALPHIPFDGWGENTLRRAAQEAGLNAEMVALWFPEGAIDAIHFHHQLADAEMVEALTALNLPAMRVPERIRTAILTRLRQQLPHRAAIRKAMGVITLPTHAAASTHMLYDTVDAIWRAAGDQSTDFNFYTKRMTLAAVYSATVLCWLGDETPDLSETSAFLDRRLKDVHRFGTTTRKCREWFSGWLPKRAS